MEAVFAILVAGGLGYWADEHFGRGPLFLVIGVAVGFAAFVVRLLRLGEQMKEFSEQEGLASGSEGDDREQEQRSERVTSKNK